MSFFTNFTLTWDFGLAVFLFFAALFYGLTAGRKKLVLFLASLYFSLALIGAVPYVGNFTRQMSDAQKFLVDAGLFLGIAILLFFLLAGSLLHSTLFASQLRGEESHWWHLILLSFITTGFFLSSILAFGAPLYYNNISSIAREIFFLHDAHFWWALAGILALAILRRKSPP